jgi:branched-chain amino acid transport system substrate-binding protein
MKKILFVVVAFMVLVSCNQQNEKIKIGLILPLTGDAAAWGIPPKNGAELAVEEINENGGLNGKKIELVIEDDVCDPTKGVAAINKIISVDKPVAIVGAVCSSATLAIAPIAEKNKTVLISPASTNPKITDAGDYIFRVIPSDELRGKVFAEYIYNLGLRNAAIIYINNDGGKGNEQTFTKYFTQLGGEILTSQAYATDAKEVKNQILKIKEVKPEFILAISQIQDAVIVLKNAKELNVQIPFYFQTEALEDPKVAELAGDAIKGCTYITFAKEESAEISDFAEKYKAKYGKEPELFSAEAYDAIKLICFALKAGNTDIKNYLYNIKSYSGASGILSFDKNGDINKPLDIIIIK